MPGDGDYSAELVSKFDGTGNVDFWLAQVEAVKTEKRWEEADLVKRSSLLLRGEAKNWYENGRLWEKKDMTWTRFSTLIKQRFSRKSPRHVVSSSIGKLKLKPKEDVRDFAARMNALANQSDPAIDNTDMCGMLLKALPVHYRTVHVTTEEGEDSFESLVNACRRIQLLDADSDTGGEGAGGNNSKDDKNGRGDNPKKFTGTCNYCGKMGHKEAECHKKARHIKLNKNQGGNERTGPNTRETNKDAAWDPKTHQRFSKQEKVTCSFCGKDGHVRDDCYKWKRLNAMIGDDDEMNEPGPSSAAPKSGRKN